MKILIIRLTSLGDIIHSMSALQFLKGKRPNLEIHWLVDGTFRDILRYNPDIDKIHTLSLRDRKGLFSKLYAIKKKTKKLSEEGFDLIIDMQGLLKTGIISSLIRGKKAGFDKNSIREAMASFFYDRKISVPYTENIYRRNIVLALEALDMDRTDYSLEDVKDYLFFSRKAQNKTQELISRDHKNILIIPSASTGERVISKNMYRKIISSLPGKKFITWGNKTEKGAAIKIAENNPNASVLPKLNLDTLKAFISRCDLVIGSDTGPCNVAFAVNTPSITIYWDGAKNSNLRNTINMGKNISFSFSDLSDFDEQIIIRSAEGLLKD